MTESSQKCPTPRQRFVRMNRLMRDAALPCLEEGEAEDLAVFLQAQRESIKAFADAECIVPKVSHDHEMFCRASILKEIFGE